MVHLLQLLPEPGEGIKWRGLPWVCVISLSLHCHMAGWFEIECAFRFFKRHVGLLFLVFRARCGRQDDMFSLYTALAAVSETSLFPLF